MYVLEEKSHAAVLRRREYTPQVEVILQSALQAANAGHSDSFMLVEDLSWRAAYIVIKAGRPVAIRSGVVSDRDAAAAAVGNLREFMQFVRSWDIEVKLADA